MRPGGFSPRSGLDFALEQQARATRFNEAGGILPPEWWYWYQYRARG